MKERRSSTTATRAMAWIASPASAAPRARRQLRSSAGPIRNRASGFSPSAALRQGAEVSAPGGGQAGQRPVQRLGSPHRPDDRRRSPAVRPAAPSSWCASRRFVPETPCPWRLRILSSSPFFPCSKWFWHPGSAASETDLRTGETTVAAAEGGASSAPSVRLLESGRPDPFAAEAEITVALPARSHLRVPVYDVTGREVTRLADGPAPARRHVIPWNSRRGRRGNGDDLPAGVLLGAPRLRRTGRSAGDGSREVNV